MSRGGPGPRCTNTLSPEAAPGISIDVPVRSRTAPRTAANVEFSASMVSCLPSQATVGGWGGFCSTDGGGTTTGGGATSCGVAGLTAEAVGLFFCAELLAGTLWACIQDVARSSKTDALVNPSGNTYPLEPRNGCTTNPLPRICATAQSISSSSCPTLAEIPILVTCFSVQLGFPVSKTTSHPAWDSPRPCR